MGLLKGQLSFINLYNPLIPDKEYDEKGIPIGILADISSPFVDNTGNERYVAVYRPSTIEPMLLTYGLYVVGDIRNYSDIDTLLKEYDLEYLAESKKAFIVFLLPNAFGKEETDPLWSDDDIDFINMALSAGKIGYLFPGREKIHDFKMGIVGSDSGANITQKTCALHPEHTNSMLIFGGSLSTKELENAGNGGEQFVWLVNTEGDCKDFWIKANNLEISMGVSNGNETFWSEKDNPAKQVIITVNEKGESIQRDILIRFWDNYFAGNIRVPNLGCGNVFNWEYLIKKDKPVLHVNDTSLGDNGSIPHTWIEFIPQAIKESSVGERYPLIIEMHGGGCNPFTSVAKDQFQELGKTKGFITVYANASTNNSWNSILLDSRPSDLDFIVALTQYLISCYPIDSERVYISGFSNGSGMAHLMAAVRPDLYAGLIAFNTRYKINDAFISASAKAKSFYDYRMPVFSTYGTKDAEWPLKAGCGQFSQMNFWKKFNNSEMPELASSDVSGIGAPGDIVKKWGNYGENCESIFTTHSFRSKDPSGICFYNYTVVNGLPHTVERRLIPAAWNFVSQFHRLSDGSLKYIKCGDSII